jgi:hypothetical protein
LPVAVTSFQEPGIVQEGEVGKVTPVHAGVVFKLTGVQAGVVFKVVGVNAIMHPS